MKKRGQAWGIDLAVAFMIFTFGILIFFFYTINRPTEASENIESLFYDGNVIADSVLSKGYPDNWKTDNVVTLGIINDDKINQTKLDNFYYLSLADYEKTKILFNTRFNYYLFLSQNLTINSSDVEGIGKKPLNEENLVKITRFIVYKDKPTTAYFYIWN